MANSIQGRRGMAVAPHALASQSALAVLREGGNAIEAMISAAATIAVAYPHMNGIGGDSFWLVASPQAGGGHEVIGIDASGASGHAVRREDYAGLSAIPFRGGQAAITVAGTLGGWDQALQLAGRLGGRLPLSRLLADAIDYGRHGVPITASQHRNTAGKLDGLKDVPGFADTFLPGGEVPATGALFRQPRLAATLEYLASAGLDDFYRGEMARGIAADLARVGSPLTLADLQACRAQLRDPLRLAHSHGTVFNMPPPTQGMVALTILGLMDRLGIERFDHLGADYVHAAVESVKQAFAVRDRHITDPAHMTISPADVLAPAALDAMAARIDMARAAPWGQGKGPADTVWMGVIDGEGRAVSMIQSVYHEFGSGIVLADSGVNWQNRGASFSLDPGHVNTLVPGKKPFHTLIPGLALLNDGRTMVYGNMGGDGQPQSQSAVFTRTVVHGLNPQDAISAPRWLLGRTWGQSSDSLKLESRFPAATVEALRARGHEVDVLGDFDETFGHAGCLLRRPDGCLEGGFDPRSDGSVAAF
ncbi:gamma-glutamyltransferase family protein [Xylophilus sp. GOD-11R]|uniref:gamma-glutamyltransferase family protein n=1 Tax=Xylophilus sp. GOD-11R TaxID=3089814 RepID=UPI00298CE9A5|nr:gamma-glutamyltransferase family protein [Xylophilus sp. GOD-11R]WPB56682.1 gamma-glutamyltransferase family protein [Xylophilus sp. GOD-11R]